MEHEDFLKLAKTIERKYPPPDPDYTMYSAYTYPFVVDPAVYIMAIVDIPITEKAFIQKIVTTIGLSDFQPQQQTPLAKLKLELWKSQVYHMYEVWKKTRHNDRADVSEIDAFFENEHKHLKAKIVAYVLRHGNDAPKVEDLPFKDMGIFIPGDPNASGVNGVLLKRTKKYFTTELWESLKKKYPE